MTNKRKQKKSIFQRNQKKSIKLNPKMSVFQFNNISEDISDTNMRALRLLYKYYHKKQWCYKRLHKKYKRLNLIFNLGGSGAITGGVIAGGITLNPIVLAIITPSGIIMKVTNEVINFNKQQEMCKIAYTTYDKILTELRTFLRGKEYDHKKYIEFLNITDNHIIDLTPAIKAKIERKYYKKFLDED